MTRRIRFTRLGWCGYCGRYRVHSFADYVSAARWRDTGAVPQAALPVSWRPFYTE